MENNIRPPDKVKVMCLYDDNDINDNDIDYDNIINENLNDNINNYDENEYENIISQILEESKKEYELFQQIKEIEEIKQQEIDQQIEQEIEKIKQIENRKKEFESLEHKLKKMINYDQTNKSIYEIILSEIDNYINNNIVSSSINTNKDYIFKVVKGIRLTTEELTSIKKLFGES